MHKLTLTDEHSDKDYNTIHYWYVFDNEKDLKEYKGMLDQLEAEYLGLDE